MDETPHSIPLQAVPTDIAIGADPSGRVLLRISTPVGVHVTFFAPESAITIGIRLAQVGRQLATKSPVPNGRSR